MKLSKENIKVINSALIKKGVHYIDIRIEIIDHFASELENSQGDFETNFPVLLQSKKNFVKQMQLNFQQAELKNGFQNLFKNIYSKRFLLAYFLTVLLIFFIVKNSGTNWLSGKFEYVPMVLPGPITLILLYNIFFSKSKSRDLVGLLSVTNLILLTYIFIFINIIRNSSTWIGIPIFSFFVVLSFFYYIFYFESKMDCKSRYESLWN